ncbi:MAG: plasmid pRiA4b ORF-3 family protein [Calditrichaeota bacterium]|nr:MAG: plasmid pRiA4b ORF-3 family protein [Calditrichota bacterium]
MLKKVSTTDKIYQIKVTLQDSNPPIWRQLLIDPEISLYDLHKIIQIAMGWSNSHLHQFIINKEYYSIPHEDDWQPVIDERKTHVKKIASAEGKKFIYEYDFGDNWSHDIVVEKILSVEQDSQYPKCIKGKRACPPEDVGGLWGYAEFLAAMKDPKHKEHGSFVEWWGGQFDPEAFDLEAINEVLQDIDNLDWWDGLNEI